MYYKIKRADVLEEREGKTFCRHCKEEVKQDFQRHPAECSVLKVLYTPEALRAPDEERLRMLKELGIDPVPFHDIPLVRQFSFIKEISDQLNNHTDLLLPDRIHKIFITEALLLAAKVVRYYSDHTEEASDGDAMLHIIPTTISEQLAVALVDAMKHFKVEDLDVAEKSKRARK